ncbi:MAG: hypothetical protein MUE46_11620 [Xanthomonadales bacterium]|jgi:hypothetical protein|nr:hypothetical protein [Xanthomonadales bacterium]
MSAFIYIVTEGVHDVAFLGRLLTEIHEASRIRRLELLDDDLRSWLNTFTWPNKVGKYHDIERLAVAAPVFYRLTTNTVVAIRNAKGLHEIGRTLEVDFEVFSRAQSGPEAVGIVLDSDDEAPEKRFAKMKPLIEAVKMPIPAVLGEVSISSPRVGVFALPAPGVAGTLEDVLLELADAAYPELVAAARRYAAPWRQKADTELATADWKEIRKPAGLKKATIGAMTAVLKPGKSTQVSLEDNRWVSEHTKALACLQPVLGFLSVLLATHLSAEKQGPREGS